MTLFGHTLSIVLDILCISIGVPAHAYIMFKIFRVKNFYRYYPLDMNVVAIASIACVTSVPIDITDKILNLFGFCINIPWFMLKEFIHTSLMNAMILTLVFISFHRVQRVRESLRSERSWSFLMNVIEIITSWSIGILTAVIKVIDMKHGNKAVAKCRRHQQLHSQSVANDVISTLMFVTLMVSLAACWILVLRYIRSQRRVQPTFAPTISRMHSQDSKDVQLDLRNDDDIASTVTAFDGNFEQNLDDVILASTHQASMDSRTGSLIESIMDHALESPNSLMSRNSSMFMKTCQREERTSEHISSCKSDITGNKVNMRLSQATSCISDSVLTNKQRQPSIQEKRNSFRTSKSKSSKYLYTQATTASIGSMKKILKRSMSFSEHMEDSTECTNGHVHTCSSAESVNKTIISSQQKNSDISHQRVSSEHVDTKVEKISDERTWTRSDSTMSRQGSIEFRLFEKQNYRENIANNDEMDISLKSFSVHEMDDESRHGQVFLSPEQSRHRPPTLTSLRSHPDEKLEFWYMAGEKETEENKSQDTHGHFPRHAATATVGENPVQIKITRPSTDCNQLMLRRHGVNQGRNHEISLLNVQEAREEFQRAVFRTHAQSVTVGSVSPTMQVSKRMILAITLSLVLFPGLLTRIIFDIGHVTGVTMMDALSITGSISNFIFSLSPYLYIFYNKSITKLLFKQKESLLPSN